MNDSDQARNGGAEATDPAREDVYWRDNYRSRPCVESGSNCDDYGPASAFGVDTCGLHPGRSFDEAAADMARQWSARSGASRLRWDSASPAVRGAWQRVDGPA